MHEIQYKDYKVVVSHTKYSLSSFYIVNKYPYCHSLLSTGALCSRVPPVDRPVPQRNSGDPNLAGETVVLAS